MIKKQWDLLSKVPGGKIIFSKMVGKMAPYTGTIRPRVIELKEGYAKVTMRDRRKIRNHLDSIHAIAMVNLGEVTTGLALLYGMPDDARGIPIGLSIEYSKKARGTLTAECTCTPITSNQETDYEMEGNIYDQQNELVAKVIAKWKVGPK